MALDQMVLLRWLMKLNAELDRRLPMVTRLDNYHAGYPAVPEHVSEIQMEPEYRVLLKQAVTNWPELIVDSVEERLEVVGFDFGERRLSDEAWDVWQRSGLDEAADLVHEAALVNGRAYAIVWTAEDDETPEIIPEHASTCVVAYERGSRRRRAAALRRWYEDERWHCALYLPDEVYKFRASQEGNTIPKGYRGDVGGASYTWEMWEEPGDEDWPLENPLGVVPVVEFAVNRTLSLKTSNASVTGDPQMVPPEFGAAFGEYERVLPVIDRINTTIFAGLLSQAWTSFPVRALIGHPIKYEQQLDGEGNPVTGGDGKPIMKAVEPFRVAVNRLIQIENPQGKLTQLPEAQLDNFTKFAEAHIRHLSAITRTPAHYLLGEMVNLSADAIRAAEAGLISKVRKHHRSLGESWEEVERLALAIKLDRDPAQLAPAASTRWKDPESRSMAERADAVSKLKDVLPAEALMEKVLQATPQEIAQWNAQGAMSALLAAATSQNGDQPASALVNG